MIGTSEQEARLSMKSLERDLISLTAKNEDLRERIRSLSSIRRPEAPAAPSSSVREQQNDLPWKLQARFSSVLKELYECSGDCQRSKELENELQIALGIDKVLAVDGKESYEEYEVRVARQWEVAQKMISLSDLGILRVIAECIPGGGAEDPLAGLQGMTASTRAELCHGMLAAKLAESLEKVSAPRGKGGEFVELPCNSKFSLNESAPSGHSSEAVYGKLEEFHGGLIDRIGLPHVNLYKGLEDDHCGGKDARYQFTTGNYKIQTTTLDEWKALTDPEVRRKLSQGPREIRDVEELLRHPLAVKAQLLREEILALQLYTGPMYYKYNAVLRNPSSSNNKFATTIHCIVSGLVKLSRFTPLTENRRVLRGLKGLRLPENFLKEDEYGVSGGVEYGLLSTTTDIMTAIQYAGDGDPIIFEINCGAIDRGASLEFLSQYPGEKEILYPPLSYLEVIKQPRYTEVQGRRVTVLELKINSNMTSMKIEDFVGKRKQLYTALMANIAKEVERDLREWKPRINERLKSAPYDFMYMTYKSLKKSITSECRKILKKWMAQTAEWYNEENNYKEAIEEAMMTKEMAMNKMRYWIEDTTGDCQCAPLISEKIKSVYWMTMADLHNRLSSKALKEEERLELSKRLCEMHGTSITSGESKGEPPIVLAVLRGQRELIPLLRAAGCDMNARLADGRTALHLGAMLGMQGCVKDLVEAGANCMISDKLGRTCAHFASSGGKLEMLQHLQGVCEEGLLLVEDKQKQTCAHEASKTGQVEVLRYLNDTCGQELLLRKDFEGMACTNLACYYGHLDVIKYFKDTFGQEALLNVNNEDETCAVTACSRGYLVLVRYLYETCGLEFIKRKSQRGLTCAHVASSGGHLEVLEYLEEICGREFFFERDNEGNNCGLYTTKQSVHDFFDKVCGTDFNNVRIVNS